MKYIPYILPSAQRDLDKLSDQVYERCYKALLRLEENPRPHGCQKLTGEEGYRIRTGDYRILHRIDDLSKKVFIYRVKHRKEVYR